MLNCILRRLFRWYVRVHCVAMSLSRSLRAIAACRQSSKLSADA